MTEAAPSLGSRPFALFPDGRNVYWTEGHLRAADCLRSGIARMAPITLLTGEPGTGKTSLVQHLEASAPDAVTIGTLDLSAGGNLCASVLAAFGRDAAAGTADPTEAFRSFVCEEHALGRRAVLVVDEAQSGSTQDLERLRQLSNIQCGADVGFLLILVGDGALRERLALAAHRQLVNRIGSDFHLPPMLPEETAGYIRYRLEAAGAPPGLFEGEALAAIHAATGGIPRTVNILCDLSLEAAARSGSAGVAARIVEAVLAEARRNNTFLSFSLGAPAVASAPGTEGASGAPLADGRAALPQAKAAAGGRASAEPEPEPAPRTEADQSAQGGPRVRAQDAAPKAPIGGGAGAPSPLAEARQTRAPEEASGTETTVPLQILAVRALASLPEFESDGGGSSRKAAKTGRKPGERPETAPAGVAADTRGAVRRRALGELSLSHRKWRLLASAGAAAAVAVMGLAVVPTVMTGPAGAAMEATAPMDAGSAVPSEPVEADRLAPTQAPAGSTTPEEAWSASVDNTATASSAVSDLPPPTPVDRSADFVLTPDELFRTALELAFVDREAAAVAFARAGIGGHPRAAYYLGQVYEAGDGVPVDLALSRAWYARAAETIPGAARRLEAIPEPEGDAAIGAPALLWGSRNPDGTVELVWTSAEGGDPDGYLVQLAATADGAPIHAEHVAVSAARLEPPAEAAYWRVRALGADGRNAVSEWGRIAF